MMILIRCMEKEEKKASLFKQKQISKLLKKQKNGVFNTQKSYLLNKTAIDLIDKKQKLSNKKNESLSSQEMEKLYDQIQRNLRGTGFLNKKKLINKELLKLYDRCKAIDLQLDKIEGKIKNLKNIFLEQQSHQKFLVQEKFLDQQDSTNTNSN